MITSSQFPHKLHRSTRMAQCGVDCNWARSWLICCNDWDIIIGCIVKLSAPIFFIQESLDWTPESRYAWSLHTIAAREIYPGLEGWETNNHMQNLVCVDRIHNTAAVSLGSVHPDNTFAAVAADWVVTGKVSTSVAHSAVSYEAFGFQLYITHEGPP